MNNISGVPADQAAHLLQQLKMPATLDIAQFWHEAATASFPLITPVANDSDLREVTFLWRTKGAPQAVYLHLNRVTDKNNVAQGMMTPLPLHDIWILTLRLPASYCGSYTFTEIPATASAASISLLGTRDSALPGQPDPLNTSPQMASRDDLRHSVLALDRAPSQAEWADAPDSYHGVQIITRHVLAGKERLVRLYLPNVPPSTPLGLLVQPDAERWFGSLGLPRAMDNAIASGRITPMAVLGIDNINTADRIETLGARSELVLDIAERLVPDIRKTHADRQWADRTRTVMAGQSLGGLTALMAARYAPHIFGGVISQSASMWSVPDKSRRPADFTVGERSWITEHILAAPPKTVRVRLNIGALEGAMVPHTERLHQRLLTAGVDSQLAIYTGGHDYAWWRGALLDSLATL
ncbi:esterase family protein [Shimwellia pseudoproteus]|uniref:alpha/beta hydrolase-fold protein n=1 Tax=Shimwellia pseudoproteus TaxID=570012 RepID=UPI0018EBA69A|nr:alpha/beta hydrolase-fold protein [Shimwellia pseudoproteus]MBJ3815663.1 esterase family protein [Shimwellia pseudoproteus]